MHEKTIKPGDHFRKTDTVYPSLWMVTRVIHTPGVPTHYMLADMDGRGEVRTISEPTLTDPDFYTPVSVTPPAPSGTGEVESQHPAIGGPRSAEGHRRPRGRAEPSPSSGSLSSGKHGWLGGLGVVGGAVGGSQSAR